MASPVLPDLLAAILLAKCIRGCGGLETKGLVQSRISRSCVGIHKAWQTDARKGSIRGGLMDPKWRTKNQALSTKESPLSGAAFF